MSSRRESLPLGPDPSVCRQGLQPGEWGYTFPTLHKGTRATNPSPLFLTHQVVGSAPAPQYRLPVLKCLIIQTGSLWTRLGSAPKTKEKNTKKVDHRAPGTEEDDSELQRAWGALIKEKEQSRQKKSRLDNLPSLQIEVSRESSSGSEAESWCPWGQWQLP